MIAEAAASVALLAYDGDNELDTHPLLDLIAQPSPDHTATDFLEAWYGFLLVSGNAYVEAGGVGVAGAGVWRRGGAARRPRPGGRFERGARGLMGAHRAGELTDAGLEAGFASAHNA
jgi:hypothetical protein